ncbi:hypothetical protein [Sulfitobacter sp.]
MMLNSAIGTTVAQAATIEMLLIKRSRPLTARMPGPSGGFSTRPA